MNDILVTMLDGSKFLVHHGVKGMHWGVHNEETRRKYGELSAGGGGAGGGEEDEETKKRKAELKELFESGKISLVEYAKELSATLADAAEAKTVVERVIKEAGRYTVTSETTATDQSTGTPIYTSVKAYRNGKEVANRERRTESYKRLSDERKRAVEAAYKSSWGNTKEVGLKNNRVSGRSVSDYRIRSSSRGGKY